MTPATMSRDTEKRRERLEEMRETVADLRERERELKEEIAEKVASGEDADELQQERRRLREDLEGFEAALPVVEERIRDEDLSELRDRAVNRMRSIKKSVGGITGEYDRQLERAEEAAETYLKAMRYVLSARPRQDALAEEAEVLAEAFGLTVPDLNRVPTEAKDERVSEVMDFPQRPTSAREERSVKTARRERANGNLQKAAVVAGSYLESRGMDAPPTPEILEELAELKAEREES